MVTKINEIDTSNWLIRIVIPAFPSLFCWWLLVAKSESPKRRSDWNKKKPLAVTDYVDGHGPDSRPTGISGAQLIMTASSPSITKVLLARKWIYWSCVWRLRRYGMEIYRKGHFEKSNKNWDRSLESDLVLEIPLWYHGTCPTKFVAYSYLLVLYLQSLV